MLFTNNAQVVTMLAKAVIQFHVLKIFAMF